MKVYIMDPKLYSMMKAGNRFTQKSFGPATQLSFGAMCVRLALTTLLYQNIALTISTAALVTSQETVESFKSFIASPPIIEDLVYCKFTARNPSIGLPESISAKSNEATVTYYHARYQPGCLFLEGRTNLNFGLSPHGPGEGLWIRWQDSYWMFDNPLLVVAWDSQNTNARSINSSPALAFHHFSDEFTEMANMGLMHLEPGTVNWEGNNFNAIGYVLEIKQPVYASGQLLTNQDGSAHQLSVEYRIGSQIHHYIEKYGYEQDVGLAYLPSVIQSFLVADKRETKLMEWRIFSIKTTSSKLPSSAFDARSIVAANHLRVLHYTNQTLYARNILGLSAAIHDARGSALASDGSAGAFLFILLAAIYTAGFFGRVWRSKSHKNQQTESTIHET